MSKPPKKNFRASGTALVYSTYLGGTGSDIGYGIAVDLLENAYAGKIEGYKGEKIRFGKETLDLPYAEVKTMIVTPQGQEFSVDYRLLADGSRWRVYDIVMN